MVPGLILGFRFDVLPDCVVFVKFTYRKVTHYRSSAWVSFGERNLLTYCPCNGLYPEARERHRRRS